MVDVVPVAHVRGRPPRRGVRLLEQSHLEQIAIELIGLVAGNATMSNSARDWLLKRQLSRARVYSSMIAFEEIFCLRLSNSKAITSFFVSTLVSQVLNIIYH